MKVPFADFKTHYKKYQFEIDGAIARVLNSGYFILGPELEKFEHEFAKSIGEGFVIGCASGTEAIYLALAACPVGPGDEVIVVAHTAVPTISAISMTGATPVFVDIDKQTYVMDVNQVERLITPKTKAIIPVHLYGQMVNMQPLMQLAAKYNLFVIEDIAQATGAKYQKVIAGTLGDFGTFSFYPSKNIGALGDGGAVFTKKKEHFDSLLMLRNYGQSKRYHHDVIGINSRLDDLQAAILNCRLPYLKDWNDRRREIALRYDQGLAHLKNVLQAPFVHPDNDHVFHLYVIKVEQRDHLQTYLMERDIQTLIHYPIPAHLQKAYAYLDYKKGDLPVCEHLAERILSLPMYPELTDNQVDYVIDAVSSFFKSSLVNPASVVLTEAGVSG